MKTCNKCKSNKKLCQFGIRKSAKDGLNYICKAWACNMSKQSKAKYPELKKYYDNKWRKDNFEHRRKYGREYHKKRKISDPLFRLSETLRSLIHSSLKGKGYIKLSKTTSLLGANNDVVMAHFKNLWLKRYKVELTNQKYEIHHITYNSTATTEEELIKLQHYTNLELLSPEDHRAIHANN